MRILLLSWEYPPQMVGGLGRHVHRLSIELAAAGHDVHVVSRAHPDAPAEEVIDGVHVLRAERYGPGFDFSTELVPWVQQFDVAVLEQVAVLLRQTEVDVIHAHDWLVAYAAAVAKNVYQLPMVATIHATEFGRHQGRLPGPMNKLIHQIEWWLTYEARRVIACSEYMRDETHEIFQLPAAKQDVVPNGIDLQDFDPPPDAGAWRAFRVAPGEKLLFFAGRLEYEKGVQTVLDALPIVLRSQPIRFFVAGVGTHAGELQEHAARLGLADRVEFLGFVPPEEMAMWYTAADLAVVPSLYEPFGIVALETMAAGTPCIAADTGGLRELVVHEATGLRFAPGDPRSLAEMILRLTTDKLLDQRLTFDARRMINHEFSWPTIARRTVEIYERAIAEEAELRGHDERLPLRTILDGSPLLADGRGA